LPGIFDIDIVWERDAAVVVVVGEVDMATAPLLEDCLRRASSAPVTTVVLDLDRVTFIDASGLRVLVSHAFSQRAAKRIRVTQGSPQVRRLLELAGLATVLPLADG
jgi:anti-anti-sigma factor